MAKRTLKVTNADDFKRYTEFVEYFLGFFGLTDWAIEIVHENLTDSRRPRAWCGYNTQARRATIGLCPNWDVVPTEEDLLTAAFHEVMELQLAELVKLAMERDATEQTTEVEIHRLIVRWENLVLPMIKDLYMSGETDD